MSFIGQKWLHTSNFIWLDLVTLLGIMFPRSSQLPEGLDLCISS